MKIKKYAAIICSLMLVAGCLISLFEIVYSGDPDVDPAWDTAEGMILTSDGTVVCECKDGDHRGTVAFPEIYGAIVGYNSGNNGRSGLRSKLKDKLYATDEKKATQGNSIVLTLDHSVQTFAYDLMLPFSTAGKDTNACAVCIENKTGRLIGLVSIKAPLKTDNDESIVYDVNHIGSFYKQVEDEKIEIPDAYYLPEWSLAKTPGSVFKCISAIPIIENGFDEEIYNDQGSITITPGLCIENYSGYTYGEIALGGGLKYSSNCFFSWMYNNYLTRGDLSEIYDRCLLGAPLDLDFVTLDSAVDLSDLSSYIMSSFGQITVVTPIQTCSLLSAICSGTGTVQKPYLIDKEISPKGKSKVLGKASAMTQITDKESALKLRKYLQETAAHYGINDGVYMKTGTAEISDGVQNYCFCGNTEYTVLISVHNFANISVDLKETALALLKYTTSASLGRDEAQDAYDKAIDTESENWFERIKHLFSKTNDAAGETPSTETTTGWFSTLVDFFQSDNM